MSKSDQKQIIAALLDRHGRTFASELGINLESETPTALFRWLCAALLFSARIANAIAVEAARALTKSGWTTAKKMAAATWEERTHVLNHAGYARYDEKTSRMLADTSELLLKCYDGDLRKLREAAEREPAREKELLMECKGIGPVGADIFLREVQVAWTELQPFADAVALKSAAKLKLPLKTDELATLVPKKDWGRRKRRNEAREFSGANLRIHRIHACGFHSNEQFVIAECRLRHFLTAQRVRTSEFMNANGFHPDFLILRGSPFTQPARCTL